MAKTALPQVIWTPGRAEEPPTSGLAFIVAVASRPNPSAAAPPIGPRRLKTPDDDGNQGVPLTCLRDPFVTPFTSGSSYERLLRPPRTSAWLAAPTAFTISKM